MLLVRIAYCEMVLFYFFILYITGLFYILPVCQRAKINCPYIYLRPLLYFAGEIQFRFQVEKTSNLFRPQYVGDF